jgi:hypothetical protein
MSRRDQALALCPDVDRALVLGGEAVAARVGLVLKDREG